MSHEIGFSSFDQHFLKENIKYLRVHSICNRVNSIVKFAQVYIWIPGSGKTFISMNFHQEKFESH